MPIINKNKRTAAIYNRGREVVKVYDHGKLAWQKSTSIPDYLCFTALESGTFTLTIPAAVIPTYLSYIEWSKDGRTWNHRDNTSEAVTIDVQVAQGDKVYWRGSGIRMGTSASNTATTDSIFTATGNFEVSGNIMSLLYGNSFDGVTSLPIGSEYTFAGLFYNNKKLLSIADLSLPATALVKGCYASMFYGCSNMTGMLSSLPATSYPMSACYMMFRLCSNIDAVPSLTFVSGNGGYQFQYMFDRCTSLVDASAIVMSASDTYSFSAMFTGCSALAVTPVMSLSTLKTGCFNITFQGCTNLKYVKCLATDISATNCLNNWLQNVSSTGTFIQAEGVEWPRGASGIPTGWVDIEKRTMPQGYKQVEYVANPNKPSATPMPIVETGIVLDPSQDTIEIAVFPHIGDDDYIAHHRYGGLPIANNMSPAQSGAKVGRFYCMYRKIDSANVIQFSWTKATSANSTLTATDKIVETPQVLRIELSSGNNKMLLNGTQVATNSDACDISDPGTETAKLFGINNVGYNWIDPIYYYKHWRNEVLIADYVACVRESDNEPSFYDFVSNTFKVPTRTGFFTAGEEI